MVKGFATLAVPLTDLLRKGVPFEWSERCQRAFEGLKSALVSAPVLAHADESKPFVISCDASDFGIGAELS